MMSRLIAIPFLYLLVCASPPHKRAVVKPNSVAQFSILTSRLIRLEYSRNGTFNNNDTLAVVNRYISPPPVFQTEYSRDGLFHIKTEHLHIKYDRKSSAPFSDATLSITLFNGNVWYPSSDPGDGNLGGTVRTLDDYYAAPDLDCRFISDPNQHCTLGLVSRNGWALVDDSLSPRLEPALNASFNFPWILPQNTINASSIFDKYFLGYGLDYKSALREWTLVSGRIPLIPRYALGSWSSRYWAYSEAELLKLTKTYHQNRIPLDILVFDMDWHQTFYSVNGGQWTGWTWDPNLFPNPQRFLSSLKEQGLRTTVNLHPADGIKPHESSYLELATRLGYSNNVTIPFQSTNATFMKEFFDIVISGIQDDGVDFFWLDWQQGENWEKWTGVEGLNPTIWLNYCFWKHAEVAFNETRPLNFHRWGGLGNHRYPVGFSGTCLTIPPFSKFALTLLQSIGDTFPNWDMLSTQIKFTVTASNVLFGYWSHDLGGHMTKSEKQLYTRWVQFGAWSPIFRTHSTKNAHNVCYFWKYPRPESDIMTDALKRRMELIPYIYTMTRVARDTGLSLLRPLYYEFPEMEEAYIFGTQYYFGDSFVVSPITQPVGSNGLVEAILWIPPGEWFEKGTGKLLNGPRVYSSWYFLEDVPILVKAGAIVPTSILPETDYFGLAAEIPRTLALEIYLGAQTAGFFTLYEDDGITSDYDNPNRQLITEISYSQELHGSLRVSISPRNGNMTGISGSRSYQLTLINQAGIQYVSVNGTVIPDFKVKVSFDTHLMSSVIFLGEFGISEPLDILVGLKQQPIVPTGLLGKFKRLFKAKEMLDDLWEVAEPPIFQDYYPSLLKAIGLISASEYFPRDDKVLGNLELADSLYGQAIEEVREIKHISGEAVANVLEVLTSIEVKE
ncbi:UNVERIFIED_CONTAM: hypothetical protein HDU68_010299 [Siphonaria sp. JEL0065]|nr:hypothetical protein HDU68_010296 [Siphonaria sp. JEL0065]KAJ3030047.1 hypothetical protein HDU68_010299 [Siphonaria sp. JEL0065]